MSLLEEAKKAEIGNIASNEVTEEQVELALAWARGDIRLKQVEVALGTTRNWKSKTANATNAYAMLARALRKAINEGKV